MKKVSAVEAKKAKCLTNLEVLKTMNDGDIKKAIQLDPNMKPFTKIELSQFRRKQKV